jgi:glutamate carboxypeptidase
MDTRIRIAELATAPDAMLDQVRRWAEIGSGSANLDGLGRMAAVLADAFSVLPGTPRLVRAQPVTAVDAAGGEREVPIGDSLHLAVRPDAPVQILLTGHMDTVYPVDSGFRHCTQPDPARLQGPGVADMKGGIAIMLAALTAFERQPKAARIGYEVVINADEETGSHGSRALIERAARGKHAGLTYEPAIRADGTLAAARPGSGNFSVAIRGRSAHAGRNPEEGRNAVVAAADLALSLALGRRAGLSVNPARIDGGGPNNVVPDLAVLRVNMRPMEPADEAEARAMLADAIERVARDHDVTVACHGGFARPPRPLDAAMAGLLATVRAAGGDLGLSIGWAPSGGVCDGNNIAAFGVPVVDTMGARGGAIHSPDEYLVIDSLAERARLSLQVLMRLATG